MNIEELIRRVLQGDLDYVNGAWFIMRQETSVNKIKHYDPEQMYEVSEEKVVTNWVQDVKVPVDFVNEEWFQIAAIRKTPANIKRFDYLASDAVWKRLLDMGGENLRYLTPQTPEMKAYAKELSVKNIGYFDSFTEQDVKELLMQDGFFIKASNGAWFVYKKNRSDGVEKKLCSLRVEDSINADFFYNKAIENDPNAAEAIVEMAKKGKIKPYKFVIEHWNMPQFKKGIAELAKRKYKEAVDIVLQNPNEVDFFQCILNIARTGKNVEARNFVFQNIDNAMCWDCIMGLAEDGDRDAQNLVLNHLDKPGSLKCVVNLAAKGKGDGRVFDVLYENAENVDCWHYILELAKNRIPRAIDIVCEHPENVEGWSCILKLAKNLVPRAIDAVCEHPENCEGWSCILELAKNRIPRAIDIVCEHPENVEGWSCILELAKNRVPRALDIVCKYPENAGGWSCLLELAKEGDGRATEVILRSQRLDLITCLAENGNRIAVRLVLASKELESVMKLAIKGNPEAKQVVLHSNDPKYIMKFAEDGDSNAVNMILQSNHLESIAKLALNGESRAIDRVLNSDDYETIAKLAETIARLALDGNSRAVRKSFENSKCKSYISKWSNAGDIRAKQVIRKWYQR